jgi:hypothetical protein
VCLNHRAMKTYWLNGGMAPRIFNLGTRWKLSASRRGRFTSRVKNSRYQFFGDWVGPRADLDAVAKRESPITTRVWNWTLDVQLVAWSLYWLNYRCSVSYRVRVKIGFAISIHVTSEGVGMCLKWVSISSNEFVRKCHVMTELVYKLFTSLNSEYSEFYLVCIVHYARGAVHRNGIGTRYMRM